MFEKPKNLIEWFKILDFHPPVKSDVAIFDEVNHQVLIKCLNFNKKPAILYSRYEKINLSLPVIFRFLFSKLLWERKVRTAYWVSMLNYLSPKTVLTLTDTSNSLSILSKYYKADFIVIQNGIKMKYDIDKAKLSQLPTFYGFSPTVYNLYKKNKININEFIPAGSLKLDYYCKKLKQTNNQKHYNICFVSQYRPQIENENVFTEMSKQNIDFSRIKRLHKAYQNLNKYIIEQNKTCIILCSPAYTPEKNEEEKKYFGLFFDYNYTNFYKRKRFEFFQPYQVMDKCDIVVTHSSTLGYEALSIGKKVLFLDNKNALGQIIFDPPEQLVTMVGIEDSYENFKERMDLILNMNLDKFKQDTSHLKEIISPYEVSIIDQLKNRINSRAKFDFCRSHY